MLSRLYLNQTLSKIKKKIFHLNLFYQKDQRVNNDQNRTARPHFTICPDDLNATALNIVVKLILDIPTLTTCHPITFSFMLSIELNIKICCLSLGLFTVSFFYLRAVSRYRQLLIKMMIDYFCT